MKAPGRKKLDGSEPLDESAAKAVTIQIKVIENIKLAFDEKCKSNGTTMSEVLRSMIDEYLNS
jgi:hypothetical protein